MRRLFPRNDFILRMNRIEEQIYAAAFALSFERAHSMGLPSGQDIGQWEEQIAWNAADEALGVVSLHRKVVDLRKEEG